MGPYEILEISRDATPDEIKAAWRKAQIRWHPDKNPGNPKAEDRFKEASEAYETLSDPDKRRIYDLGIHINPDGSFDPSTFDPSKINSDDLIQNFVRIFGVYLDERIPGFREYAKAAANHVAKEQSKKKTNKKRKKSQQSYACTVCKDTKRIKMRQGNFEISVGCRRCETVR